MSQPIPSPAVIELEICIDSIQSAIQAIQGGATALEICSSLVEGGLTPSIGLVQEIIHYLIKINNSTIILRIMIRSRSGDFVYDEHDIHVMENDMAQFRTLFSKYTLFHYGFVLGILTKDGLIHTSLVKHFVELSQPIPITFHRAIDVSNEDPILAVRKIASTGCVRILTSGFHHSAMAGIDILHKMNDETIQLRREQQLCITIAVGGGVDESNIQHLKQIIGNGCTFHGSLRQIISCQSEFQPKHRFIIMGSEKINTSTSEYEIKITSSVRVANMIKKLLVV
jgi:copper homeostasis protein